MNFIFISGLFILSTVFMGHAKEARDENPGTPCTFVDPETKETDSVTLYFETRILLRLRYLGSTPDRFYAETGLADRGSKRIYTEFGSKKDMASPIQLKVDPSSELIVTIFVGGTYYSLKKNGKTIPLKM